jgi:hypothetical protein
MGQHDPGSQAPARGVLEGYVATVTVHDRYEAVFELSPRHHRMFIEGVDQLEASLSQKKAIVAFEAAHWTRQPWLKSIALMRAGVDRPKSSAPGPRPTWGAVLIDTEIKS